MYISRIYHRRQVISIPVTDDMGGELVNQSDHYSFHMHLWELAVSRNSHSFVKELRPRYQDSGPLDRGKLAGCNMVVYLAQGSPLLVRRSDVGFFRVSFAECPDLETKHWLL